MGLSTLPALWALGESGVGKVRRKKVLILLFLSDQMDSSALIFTFMPLEVAAFLQRL